MVRFVKISVVALGVCGLTACASIQKPAPQPDPYSLIGKITVKDGMRAEFTQLLSSVLDDSNCISCRIIADKSDVNALWVSETWPSEAAHDDALKTPKAMSALKAGRPMIVKMERMADNG